MTQGECAVPTIVEIERRLQELSKALSAGRRPSHEEADRLRIDVGRLARSEGLAPWRSAELHADVQEVVRHALPPVPRPVEVPAQRGLRRRTRQGRSAATEAVPVAPPAPRPAPIDLDAFFLALREQVDALHDAVEAGARPSRPEFERLHDALTAFRRRVDGPEIRQMLDDVELLHRVVLAAARRSKADRSGARGEQRPRGRFVGQSSAGRRRLGTSHVRRKALSRGRQASPEEAPLVAESLRLRDRAERFAGARSAGRVLPLRESDRLFLHFRIVRPQVDTDTRALNDAAVRRLAGAVVEARARQGQ